MLVEGFVFATQSHKLHKREQVKNIIIYIIILVVTRTSFVPPFSSQNIHVNLWFRDFLSYRPCGQKCTFLSTLSFPRMAWITERWQRGLYRLSEWFHVEAPKCTSQWKFFANIVGWMARTDVPTGDSNHIKCVGSLQLNWRLNGLTKNFVNPFRRKIWLAHFYF